MSLRQGGRLLVVSDNFEHFEQRCVGLCSDLDGDSLGFVDHWAIAQPREIG
ncbi:MAG: hypothetical protein AB4042_19355 [Leptolyngbyaceae cyanobacterium]